MRNYKEYKKENIGSSDIAALIFVGMDDDIKSVPVCFGSDGTYNAYIVDGDCEIPEHYREVAKFKNWLRVYDDDGLTYHVRADHISVYRAGDFGIIIRRS